MHSTIYSEPRMDPFHQIQEEVEASLAQAHDQNESYKRIKAGAPQVHQDELLWAEDELKATLTALEADIEELDDSIAAVESEKQRFGLSAAEVRRRKDFVQQTRKSLQALRVSVGGSSSTTGGSRPNSYAKQTSYRDEDEDLEDGDPNAAFELQQQEAQGVGQMMMHQQDTTLDSIAGVVGTLKQQASVMGHEVMDQVSMLTSLDQSVDRTQNRLDSAQRKMNDFIRQNKNSKSSWCILLLIIVLCILLLLIVLL